MKKNKKKSKKKDQQSKKNKKIEALEIEQTESEELEPLNPLLTESAEHFMALVDAPYTLKDKMQLHPTEIRTLSLIASEGSITLTQLAQRTGNSKSAVSKPIRRLCEKALIDKTPTPGNARENQLTLKVKGKTALSEVKTLMTRRFESLQTLEASLSPKEYKIITAFLRAVNQL